MQINIQREDKVVEYKIPFKSSTLLQALYHIKNHEDNSLTFSSNCRSGICGTCAIRVNGKEVLACATMSHDGYL
ncbi:MAG TPA: 2Fe-2S iron-sulfur cluster binding domain-containing protein, partial [Sulfurovum sp.]|nr:2Fe-2S iron-sulfur cluster binding domain-containing protein [Sulfurovum sp.]